MSNTRYVRLGSSYIFKKKLMHGKDDIYYFMVGGKAFDKPSCHLCKMTKGIPSKNGSIDYPPCSNPDGVEICVDVDKLVYIRYVNFITNNLSLFLISYDRSVRARDKINAF